MARVTLASSSDVRAAGNFSQKVDESSLLFYLELASYFLEGMITSSVYADAVGGSLPSDDTDRLKKAEALMAVSFGLPALGTVVAESGALRTIAVGGRGGELQTLSFVRELKALAEEFMSLARVVIPSDYISSDDYKRVWYAVIQRIFPGLDEMPTVAPIKSYAESLLKEERGDEAFDPTHESGA